MICPICTHGELKSRPGKQMLAGWLAQPDVVICPSCGSTAEVLGENLRYTSVPDDYAVFLGDALSGAHSPDEVRHRAGRARQALQLQTTLLDGDLPPCPAPIKLRPTETCIYTIPNATLEEQRTRQGQPYWAAKETGPLTVTEDNLYVGDRNTPIRSIRGAGLLGRSVHIDRSDRKRHNRITFADDGTAYFAALAMSRVVGTLEDPKLRTKPFHQKSSGIKLAVPVGKGKRTRVSLWAIPILVGMLAVMCPCIGTIFAGSPDEAVPQPTRTAIVVSVKEPADIATATAEPDPTSTQTVQAVEGSMTDDTDTVEPTPTERATETPRPMATSTATPKPTPPNTPSPTSEPANCWNAQYVADVTIPDGTRLDKNEDFTKIWSVRNTGTCSWEDVALEFVSGESMGAKEIPVPNAAPGETVEIAVPMTAPATDGRYSSSWRFSSATRDFGSLTLLIWAGPLPTATPKPVVPTIAPAPAPVQPTDPPAEPAAVCDCSYNKYNCSDFATHAAAQACYNYCVSIGRGNIHKLDGNDNDGIACESLP